VFRFDRIKRAVSELYLRTTLVYARRQISQRCGARDFSCVKIVAAMRRHNGITMGANLQYQAMRRLGVNVELLDATDAMRDPFFRLDHDPGSLYIFHSGGPQIASLLCGVLPQAARAYRVAYWAWELPEPPGRWPKCDGIVSEIWTPSAYAQRSLAKGFRQPIRVVPHFVTPQAVRQRTSKGPFTVLTLADSRSSFARKNPAGAVAAFVRAFGSRPDARLLLKLNGPPADLREICGEAYGATNIELIDRVLSEEEMQQLFASADVLLSLHRAEGFGIPMAEAMAHGVPVIATGWSGNLEFMDASNSLLVPYRLVPLKDTGVYDRYSDSCVWAEPDIGWAADQLRQLAADRGYYDRFAAAAHASIAAFSRRWCSDLISG
jgi:glycosyltransferase involved in cell wall biosynthesis